MDTIKNIRFSFLLIIMLSAITSCSPKSSVHDPQTVVTENASKQGLVMAPGDTVERHKTFLRNNWMNLIHVKKSRSYKTGRDHIGIFGLKVEIDNTLDYPLDSVKILVPYYSRGECIQTVVVQFSKIPAHGNATMKVADNATATSYQIQVRKVNSSALQLCFDIDDSNREGDDPYKCK